MVQILKALVEDYAYSPQANCRKGGLLALAAAAVALADRKGVGNHQFDCTFQGIHALCIIPHGVHQAFVKAQRVMQA